MRYILKCKLLLLAALILSCQKEKKSLSIQVENKLDFSRREIVSIKRSELKLLLEGNPDENIRVKRENDSGYLPTQWIDNDNDGENDELLFQAIVEKKSKTVYSAVIDTGAAAKSTAAAYSRFVPERIDDYAWENNKVAFRTYGPTAQQLTEQGKEGGTLSSGIDLWFKSKDYPIIDSWYKKNTVSPGYYHIDHGEGYDPYHVGASRGTGGSGVWENDSLYVSKNYIKHRTIAAGPLRTVFELSYAPWSRYGITELKKISLDVDTNFSKFEITLDADKDIPNYAVGISLHEKKGEVNINKKKGWIRHWEPIDHFYSAEGIVLNPDTIEDAFVNNSQTPDQSNLLVTTKPLKKIIYYAGFAWTGSGQISDVTQWDDLLNKQAQIIKYPLIVTIKK